MVISFFPPLIPDINGDGHIDMDEIFVTELFSEDSDDEKEKKD